MILTHVVEAQDVQDPGSREQVSSSAQLGQLGCMLGHSTQRRFKRYIASSAADFMSGKFLVSVSGEYSPLLGKAIATILVNVYFTGSYPSQTRFLVRGKPLTENDDPSLNRNMVVTIDLSVLDRCSESGRTDESCRDVGSVIEWVYGNE